MTHCLFVFFSPHQHLHYWLTANKQHSGFKHLRPPPWNEKKENFHTSFISRSEVKHSKINILIKRASKAQQQINWKIQNVSLRNNSTVFRHFIGKLININNFTKKELRPPTIFRWFFHFTKEVTTRLSNKQTKIKQKAHSTRANEHGFLSFWKACILCKGQKKPKQIIWLC